LGWTLTSEGGHGQQCRAPVVEEQVEEKLKAISRSGQLRAITDAAEAVRSTDLSLVCVGTPSLDNGDINLTYLKRVCRQIGEALKEKEAFHVVVIRSTLIPGSTDESLIPILEECSARKPASVSVWATTPSSSGRAVPSRTIKQPAQDRCRRVG